MRYIKALNQVDRYTTAAWGPFTRYVEIADDQFAWRQVDAYANGNRLRYDRTHWADRFGSLGDGRHTPEDDRECRHRFIVSEITAAEFEAAWAAVQHAPNQPQQYGASSFADIRNALSEPTPEHFRRMPPWIAALFDGEERSAGPEFSRTD